MSTWAPNNWKSINYNPCPHSIGVNDIVMTYWLRKELLSFDVVSAPSAGWPTRCKDVTLEHHCYSWTIVSMQLKATHTPNATHTCSTCLIVPTSKDVLVIKVKLTETFSNSWATIRLSNSYPALKACWMFTLVVCTKRCQGLILAIRSTSGQSSLITW